MLDLLMPKWTKSKTTRYLYKFYPYKKDKTHPFYLDRKQFRQILIDFFELVQTHIVNGNIYYPPYGMGEFRAHKFKQKIRKSRNYGLEKKYFAEHGVWKKIYHQNFHSNGERVKIGWFVKGYDRIPLKRYYRFHPAHGIKLKLARKLLTEGNIEDYYKVQKTTRLKDIKTLI